jgi:16S rRNA (guanine966-N2)-methyltransferase
MQLSFWRPYAEDWAAPALVALAAARWLLPDAHIVAELPAKRDFTPPSGFTILDERRYGAAKIVFLRYSAATASAPASSTVAGRS